MNMPTPPREDSRDRRRRQNRESQRRWRVRYMQAKPDDSKKLKNTPPGVDEAKLYTPSSSRDRQSPPRSKRSLESQNINAYLFENTNWFQDQPEGQPDAHASWPPMDFSFPLQQGERSASTHSQNDKLSREDSTNGYLNGLDEALVQTSPRYTVSSQIRGQFSHFPSVGTRHPASLTPPAASNFTGVDTAYQIAKSGAQCKEIKTVSEAEKTIQDVQLLYRIGVEAGFLKRDDKVKYYLAAMKRTYRKVPTLMDEDYEGPSESDLDE